MEITSKLANNINIIPLSQNPKPHHSIIQLPLYKPHRKIPKPIKTPPRNPISVAPTTVPSDILRLLDCLGFPVPDPVYISLIKECTHFQDSNQAVLLHTHLAKNRCNRPRLGLLNRVLIMYVSCGCLPNARQVFDEMTKRDFNSWAVMIAGYSDIGDYEEVINLFMSSEFRYIVYSCSSFHVSWVLVCVLKACANTLNLKLGEQIHGWLLKSGYTNDLFVGSSLISFYGKIGCFEDGDLVFDQMNSRHNVAVWTARISNGCKEERFRRVIDVFKEMGKEGVKKNSFTFSSVLSACAKISDDGNCGEQVHANAIKLGLASESYVQCGLVNMYGKFGLINDAKRVFNMNDSKRNHACWNAMFTSFVQNGCLVEAIKFLYQMKAAGVQPQELWLTKLRSLCGSELLEIK
uniref:pentatricopeptide repeat-containing protein At1g31790 n=1 Tax=Erigeron canadensis TaxID=72917 RepID=UPI001CB97C67|nr:pentatricopeptide repeat-containing protein At1g31790 [Erigeron canadensis]